MFHIRRRFSPEVKTWNEWKTITFFQHGKTDSQQFYADDSLFLFPVKCVLYLDWLAYGNITLSHWLHSTMQIEIEIELLFYITPRIGHFKFPGSSLILSPGHPHFSHFTGWITVSSCNFFFPISFICIWICNIFTEHSICARESSEFIGFESSFMLQCDTQIH